MTSTAYRTAPIAPHWGDRTKLLSKAMSYALSLEFDAVGRGSHLEVTPSQDVKGAASKTPEKEQRLRHLFDQRIVVTPDGLRCDVPTGWIVSGSGQIGDPADISTSWLTFRIRTTVPPEVKLLVEALGVINFDGGIKVYRSREAQKIRGNAFIATSHASSVATYRWLERRQLFGVGRVEGERHQGDWKLRFSFDLYAAQ